MQSRSCILKSLTWVLTALVLMLSVLIVPAEALAQRGRGGGHHGSVHGGGHHGGGHHNHRGAKRASTKRLAQCPGGDAPGEELRT